ncbi:MULTISPECIES: beta-ketoacyl-ACP synthase II [unclassified Paenibacillus]|uniref:beta-ketoacyl-ACP synthase II n=1 Tax=unclassified Paenibacillus TaxID=185978 RepID=UPI0024067533|nr:MULTISPECIES: beta-ketoacyl-ACP synthase II [unclassified Paenibacillus]MDF9843011.1 3-oxoacyl-[acyl-carrier-protein] synthase II [Paenibacillus sp. PastF-2]MDF9849599.1 3-oxoacyl-[acyl-carrier-protein] synthase II [Paenibacillus sp. PastM-2]MDF9856026.1 3-oxoacyl-[acyl-carrier-protein] synthase II [Paenibacillus sp. PastF-1]MDH6481442.1 3-oxoacyl-[acyl-carrier-protein] synthase II [Paenibacillus sp. PastH-2]MDH6508715.1 3-oxoacyl-[acyl-carrier-protein] synthase II [Paenibacillus sp. PastM-
MERVVITGMGVISPLGNSVEQFWRRLSAGESGVSPITSFDTARYKSKIAGQVRDFDPEGRFGRKEARRMDRFTQFALAAAEDAWADSGLQLEQMDRERLGVYVGSGVGGIHTLMEQAELLRTRGPERVSPTLIPMLISNMAAAAISIRFGALGPALSPVTACSIGNTAIGEAFRLIRYGGADCIIAGGAEAAVTEISLASFGNATSLSTRNEEPEKASRPFDGSRDGFVIGEGGAILILESLTHALRRSATIYAEVTGYGASSDAYHMVATHPEGTGAYLAMKLALGEAGIQPEEVDLISAHATSTLIGDRSETAAIKKLFGKAAYRIPVTANKSMTGHALGAAGGLEAVALIKSIEQGLIPPTINQETPDEVCDLDYVPNTARKAELDIGISNSFGFGGHNAVIVLRKYR